MGMTITEKILAGHSGHRTVGPGDNIWVDVDVLMTHDVCGPGTIEIFKKQFGAKARVWDPEKVGVIPDHYIFTADQYAHRNVDILRSFVEEQQLPCFYDVGTPNIKESAISLFGGRPYTAGEVLFGTDSHTCTAVHSVNSQPGSGTPMLP
jgi:3-isopropylmalate/(R)-2-methylmalate dehydratase large subunit